MRHNDLDLQTDDLKLDVCLPVLLQYQVEYVLLNNNQKYGITIAYLINCSAYLYKLMKGHNQHGD